jgi:hypothetical protein
MRMLNAEGISVAAIHSRGEFYAWIYTDGNRLRTLRSIGRMAANEKLSLTWGEAAQLAKCVKQNVEESDGQEI